MKHDNENIDLKFDTFNGEIVICKNQKKYCLCCNIPMPNISFSKKVKKINCQKWDSNPRPHKWTAT